MAWLKEAALAVLGKGWEWLVWLAGVLKVWGNGLYDPPPRARKWFFLTAVAIFASGWLTFAFVNSWFYKPTVALFTSIDTGDVALPEIPATYLPEVSQPLPELKPTLVCEDMSDTPRCVPVGAKVAAETVESLPPPVAKPKLQKKAKRKVRKVKSISPQDYFCAGFQC